MSISIEQTLGKTCLIGLSYFNNNEVLIKQSMLGGKIIDVDIEKGITVKLESYNSIDKGAVFIVPADLSCWFIAPKGEFHTSNDQVKIINPDYLVTWDIYQTKDKSLDAEQQWWKWQPRTQAPQLNS